MPIYRDPITKRWKFDGLNLLLTIMIIASSTVGSYYANRAVTAYRLEKCEAESAKCRTEIKDVNDKLTNHAMGESGHVAKLEAVKDRVDRMDGKLDAILSLSKATRDSQRARGY